MVDCGTSLPSSHILGGNFAHKKPPYPRSSSPRSNLPLSKNREGSPEAFGHGVLTGGTGYYCAGQGFVSCYAFALPGSVN